MNRILALAGKDLTLLWRDKSAMFWVLVFPLLIAVLFGSIFGGSGGSSKLHLGIADNDNSEISRKLVSQLQHSPAVIVQTVKADEASASVRKGALTAYLEIPKGFAEGASAFPMGRLPDVSLGVDPSRKAEAGILQGVISESVMKAVVGDTPNAFGGPPVKTVAVSSQESVPATAFEVTFPQAILWGLLGVVTTFAISIVKERQQGTFARLLASPMSFGEILLGKGLACFTGCVLVSAALLLVGKLFFGIRIDSPPLMALALLCIGYCLVGIMMFLSVLGKTEQAVSGSAWGVLMIFAMLGGGMVPVFMMPGWMQSASSASPLKWAVVSIEGAVWRGFSISDAMLPCGILLAVGTIAFFLGVRVLRERNA